MTTYKLLIPTILTLFFCTSALRAQPFDSLGATLVLPVEARLASADHLGQVYVVNAAGVLEKYAPDGRLLSRYTNNRLGALRALDVSNPLKTLLWFADFRTVVYLDRSLTPLGELNLIEAGFPEVRTVAWAADGNLWIYDEAAFRLRKITPEGMQRYESQELNLLFPDRLQIVCLRDDGARVFAADPLQGVVVFDVFAQYSRQLALKGVKNFQLLGDELVYCADGWLHREDLRAFRSRRSALPAHAGADVWLGAGRLLASAAGKTFVWSF